jgi:hypothetical protein
MPLGDYPDLRSLLEQVEARSGQFSLEDFGASHEERSLIAVVGGSTAPDAETVVVVANIHGIEHISAQVAVAFLEGLVAGDGDFGVLRERARVVVVPVLNPDGFVATHERRGAGRLKHLRTNARGVDLNRNFPLPEGEVHTKWPFGGTNNEAKPTFRGPEPGSEPEVRALLELTAEWDVRAVASLHSFMGTLVTPRLKEKTLFKAYDPLVRAFADAQTERRYRRLGSRYVDGFTGELEDYFHHVRDAWAVCVETLPVLDSIRQHLRAPSTFWRFNPRERELWAQHDAPAVAAFLRAGLESPRPSRILARGGDTAA